MTPLRTLEADRGTTRKTLWRLFDGALVESVLMRYPDRVTMCVSSQAGCGMACPFCATGQGGLQRNMSTAEIVEQVVAGARSLARGEVPGGPGRVSNVVFMGMGEPMANYKAVIGAVRRLTDPTPDGLGMSARGITVSTVGLVPRINQLTDEGIPVTLALSLHAPDDELRDELVPVNTRWKVGEAVEAAWNYARTTKRRVSIEYAMMRGINDQAWRADLLGDVLNSLRRLGLGARQPDPAQPDAGLEVDRQRPDGRARVRPPARGQGHPDHRARHPRPRDRRRLRAARRASRTDRESRLVQSGLSRRARVRHDRHMTAPTTEAQLKADAIGFVDALVIGLAATSPAYSLAAVIGPIAALVGVYAPGVLLASFVPMALIATAFLYLNRVDQDCGTTFSWVTRAMGPWLGWIGGWAITMTGVLVIGSLADVGVSFTLLMFGADGAADNAWIRMPLAILLILLMTWICVLGTDISARLQNALIFGQVGALLVFAVVAICARPSTAPARSTRSRRRCRWLNPFGEGGSAPVGGPAAGRLRLLGLGVGGQPQRGDHRRRQRARPRRRLVDVHPAGHLRLGGLRRRRVRRHPVADRQRRRGGVRLRGDRLAGDGRLGLGGALRRRHLGDRLDPDDDHPGVAHRALDGAPARAAAAARPHPPAAPHAGRQHLVGRRASPSSGTSASTRSRANALFDSLTALSLLIAFYYALTGVACAVYYRRHLLESPKNLLLIGVGPLVGLGAAGLAAGAVGPRHVRPGRTPTAARRGSASARPW